MKTRYGLEIRAAAATDAPGLCDLLSSAGVALPPRVLADRLDAARRDPGAALLASDWGPPSGLVMLHWYRTLDADRSTALITALLVSPEARRRGIGRLLIKAAAQAARVAGCGTLRLLASPEVPSLRAFCLAAGFVDSDACFVRPLRKRGLE